MTPLLVRLRLPDRERSRPVHRNASARPPVSRPGIFRRLKDSIHIVLLAVAVMMPLLSACSESVVMEEPAGKKLESHYLDIWCAEHEGWLEAPIPAETPGRKGTRCDCLTDTYAVEVEFCPKWAEAIGQSLYYAARTGKYPGIVLVCEERGAEEFAARLQAVTTTYGLPITVWMMDSSR